MTKSARPKHTNVKEKCKICGKHDLPTHTNECRQCNPNHFYNLYPPTKR